MTRLSKIILTILTCFLLSIVAQQMVATSGYVIGGSVDQAAIQTSIGRVFTEQEMAIEREKAYEAQAKVITQYKKQSGLEKHQYLKAASWQYTWIPWVIMGLVIRLKSVSEWLFVLVPLGFLTVFKLVWLRELFLITFVVFVASYTKTYLLNRYNQQLKWTR